MRYKIIVKTLQGYILTFTVSNYSVLNGFVCFIDEKSNVSKKFHSTNTEIIEVEEVDL